MACGKDWRPTLGAGFSVLSVYYVNNKLCDEYHDLRLIREQVPKIDPNPLSSTRNELSSDVTKRFNRPDEIASAMRWISTQTFATLYERLVSRKPDAGEVAHRLEDIRHAMLSLLGDEGVARYPQLARRIEFCVDEMALWYARSELMAALADLYDEETAHRRLTRQSAMFRGLLPKSMMARPSAIRG